MRASTTETNGLADAFRRAVEDCRRDGTIAASLTVTGDAKEMHPVVRDDLYRIGYEAIRNARTYSRASRVDPGRAIFRNRSRGVGARLSSVFSRADGK